MNLWLDHFLRGIRGGEIRKGKRPGLQRRRGANECHRDARDRVLLVNDPRVLVEIFENLALLNQTDLRNS